MFVKLISDIGQYKAGAVIDVAEGIARGYIAAELAEESDAGSHLNSIVDQRLAVATAPITSAIDELSRSIKAGAKTSNGPPSKGLEFNDEGVPFNGAVEGTESPADRGVDGKNVTRGLGEIIGLISQTRPAAPAAERDYADKRLVEVFKLDRIASFHGSDAKAVSRAGTESMSGGSGYGYFIKPELLAGYFEVAMEDSIFEPFTRPIPVGATNEIKWPAIDQYFQPATGQTASAAGIRVFRKGEITQRQASDAKIREITYKITDLTGYTSFSRDLVADNYISAASVVQDLFLRALAWTKDFEFINGSGGDKPTGFRQSEALLTATRANTGKIKLGDLQNMMALFHQSRYKSAMWLAHQSTYTELLTLTQGSSSLPAFIPNASIDQSSGFSLISGNGETGNMKFASHGTLLGKPIRFTTDKLEVLGTVGDIFLVDPFQYGVASRAGVEVGVSEHFSFDTDQIAYRFKLRNDGKSLWTGPYNSTSPSGVNYKTSPFVQLSVGS